MVGVKQIVRDILEDKSERAVVGEKRHRYRRTPYFYLECRSISRMSLDGGPFTKKTESSGQGEEDGGDSSERCGI